MRENHFNKSVMLPFNPLNTTRIPVVKIFVFLDFNEKF